MARSLSCIFLLVLLMGCTNLLPTKTPRLSDVLATQEQAESAYRANDTQRAAALYLQLTKMVPREADYWYMLGNTYVRAEEPDRAVQAYQQAIARDPNHSRAWHNLGIVRMRQARAAFVSSASTAKEGDPMHDMSTHLADELAHIGSPPSQMAAAPAPVPVAVTKPVARGSSTPRRKPGATDQP
jgi:hypothetical protein